MLSGQRILVVDGLSETEEVLKAVLEPRGMQVDRVSRLAPCKPDRDPSAPSVIVLHAEDQPDGAHVADGWNTVPRVIIGSTRAPGKPADNSSERYLQGPFQYGELIQAIESLLSKRAA